MWKVLAAIAFAVASAAAHADAEYYECTRPDGLVEYSLYECEEGQEQRFIGGKESVTSPAPVTRRRPVTPAPHHDARRDDEKPLSKEFHLATYKCTGKAGDILFTDAHDYLAFGTHRCKQMSLEMACAEVLELKTRDPLAVVSSKLKCP